MELNDNGDTTYQTLWETMKAIPRGEFIELNAYIKKQNKNLQTLEVSNKSMMDHRLRTLDKQDQAQYKNNG